MPSTDTGNLQSQFRNRGIGSLPYGRHVRHGNQTARLHGGVLLFKLPRRSRQANKAYRCERGKVISRGRRNEDAKNLRGARVDFGEVKMGKRRYQVCTSCNKKLPLTREFFNVMWNNSKQQYIPMSKCKACILLIRSAKKYESPGLKKAQSKLKDKTKKLNKNFSVEILKPDYWVFVGKI